MLKAPISVIQKKVSPTPKVGPILITKQEINNRTKELAKQISLDYKGKNPLVIGILKGAGIFLADLIRKTPIDLQVDYMAVSSYGASTKTSGIVRILKDLDEDIKDRHVVIIEDIIDSGLTLSYLLKNLKHRGPASLEICSLLIKKGSQKLPIDVKYRGFLIDKIYVVGYGLDFKQKYRNLKNIHILENAPTNNGH